jgi:hypothetical protein
MMPKAAPEITVSSGNGLEDLLARASTRDRAAIEKHLAACDAEPTPAHAKLWRRLASKLCDLAPLPVRTVGEQAVLFFIADGKYRMQVFALEDNRDGQLIVYLPDVMTQAVREKVISKSDNEYVVGRGQKLVVQAMDNNNSPDAPQSVKHMLGWNRKAIRLTLNVTEPDSSQVSATENLCALAARKWAPAESVG